MRSNMNFDPLNKMKNRLCRLVIELFQMLEQQAPWPRIYEKIKALYDCIEKFFKKIFREFITYNLEQKMQRFSGLRYSDSERNKIIEKYVKMKVSASMLQLCIWLQMLDEKFQLLDPANPSAPKQLFNK